MSRDSNRNAIPAGLMVVLWGSVAAWVHFGLGATGYEVALTHDDHKAISELSDKVRDRVISSQQTFEIGSGGVSPVASVEPPPLPSAFAPPPPMAKKAEIKPPPTPTVKKPDAPKDPAKKVVIVTKDPNPPEVLPPPPQMDKRIAVRQHVKPNQTDNPNAHFVGDEANTVGGYDHLARSRRREPHACRQSPELRHAPRRQRESEGRGGGRAQGRQEPRAR